ncbi:MAG: AtpZ/AtpI family protein [Phycisphaerae bacterium]
MNYVAAVAGFGLAGWWIDSKWDTGPWGVLIGAALGLMGATYNLVRESMAAFKALEDKNKTPRRDDSSQE